MSDKADREAIKSFSVQSELAKTLQVEAGRGLPQLKRRERAQLLGQFRERVLWGITKASLDGKTVHASFEQVQNAGRIERVLIRSDVASLAMPYVRLCSQRHLPFTFVQSPEFAGDVVVVVVGAEAVDLNYDPIVGV